MCAQIKLCANMKNKVAWTEPDTLPGQRTAPSALRAEMALWLAVTLAGNRQLTGVPDRHFIIKYQAGP